MTAGGDRLVVAKYPKDPVYVKFNAFPMGPFFVLSGTRMRVDASRDLDVRLPRTRKP